MTEVVVDGIKYTQYNNGHVWMTKDGKVLCRMNRNDNMNEKQLRRFAEKANRAYRLLNKDDKLLERASEAYEAHKAEVDDWQEGDIDDCWIDENGNLCVKYESGKWWHYNDGKLPSLTWW